MMSAKEVRFTTADGTEWTVHEVTDAARPWAGKSLIFVSTDGFRRVYEYPDDWRTLDAEGLHALSWKR